MFHYCFTTIIHLSSINDQHVNLAWLKLGDGFCLSEPWGMCGILRYGSIHHELKTSQPVVHILSSNDPLVAFKRFSPRQLGLYSHILWCSYLPMSTGVGQYRSTVSPYMSCLSGIRQPCWGMVIPTVGMDDHIPYTMV